MRRRVEKLARSKKLPGKGGSEKSATAARRAVENEDGIANGPRRVFPRLAKGGVVNAQLRQQRSVGETEVAQDEIALMTGRAPRWAREVTRCCGRWVLPGGDRGSQDDYRDAYRPD